MAMSGSVVVVGAVDAVKSENVIVSTSEYMEEADTTQEAIDFESDDDDWDKISDVKIHMNSYHQDDSDEDCFIPRSTSAPKMSDREKLEDLVAVIDIRRQTHETELEVLADLVRRFGENVVEMVKAVSEQGFKITGSKAARSRRLLGEVLGKTVDICTFLGFGYYINFLQHDVINYDIVLQAITRETAGLLQTEGLLLILRGEASPEGTILLLSAFKTVLSSVELKVA
jgi:hypothetical protein